MSFFIEAIKERIWPTFVNEKNPMKWVFFNGNQDKENPRHKNFTILKKHYEPRQSNNKK